MVGLRPPYGYASVLRWRGPMADNIGSKVSYFLAGLGIGALVGILFAPKSGDDTREFLSKKADEGRDYAQKKARELRERDEDLLERSKQVATRHKDSLSAAVDARRLRSQRANAKAHQCPRGITRESRELDRRLHTYLD